MSLLEADVALPVVRSFLQRVKDKSVGQIVKLRAKAQRFQSTPARAKSCLKQMEVTPEWHFIKICQEELTALMGNHRRRPHGVELGQERPDGHHDGRSARLGQDHHRRQAGALAA
jgi:signal recognition particle GTPase